MSSKPTLLLHVCCAPCSTYVFEVLKEGYELIAYFYNPNIHPKEEYLGRLEAMRTFSKKAGLSLIEGKYDPERWFKEVKGYEEEPEGGKRCELCYRIRMERAAKLAKEKGCKVFTTTLTISPHKKAEVINSIGKELSRIYGIKFYEADFKKGGGFKRSVELSKEYKLYRQDYCGCIFSKTRE